MAEASRLELRHRGCGAQPVNPEAKPPFQLLSSQKPKEEPAASCLSLVYTPSSSSTSMLHLPK